MKEGVCCKWPFVCVHVSCVLVFLCVQCNEGSLHLAQLQLPAEGYPDEVVAPVFSNGVGPVEHSMRTLTGVLRVVAAPLSFPRLLKTASEFPLESGGQESKHHVSVLSDIK